MVNHCGCEDLLLFVYDVECNLVSDQIIVVVTVLKGKRGRASQELDAALSCYLDEWYDECLHH